MRQRTERNERNKIERIYTISEIIIHGVQVENLAQWPNYVPQQNDRCEQEVKKREHERKKEINYEPCVLPKFIQFTRIVCNDDDSHLACVWRAKALHKIGVMHSEPRARNRTDGTCSVCIDHFGNTKTACARLSIRLNPPPPPWSPPESKIIPKFRRKIPNLESFGLRFEKW